MKLTVRRPATRVGLPILALALATALSGCGGSDSSGTASASGGPTPSASNPVALRVAYNPNPTNTTVVAAVEQGFFKKNGLDVKLTTTEASTQLLPSIGKQFDLITVTPPSVLQASAQGLNPVLAAGQQTEDNAKERLTYLVGGKDITSIDQLKGKTIAVPSLSGNLYEGVVVALHKAGINKSDVKFLQVPFTDTADALGKGTVQAAATIFPFQFQLLGMGGHDLGNTTTMAGGNPAMAAGWVASKSWAEANGPVLAAWNKSQEEALAWIKKNPDQAREILVKDFHLPAEVAKTYPVANNFSFTVTPDYLQPWIQPMKDVGDLPSDFNTPASDLVLTNQ